jgi:hypothetical protein
VPKGVKSDEVKAIAVKNIPVPSNTKQLKAFLGLAGYCRRFVPNFSPIAKPLHRLTCKNTPYIWGNDQQEIFETLKNILWNQRPLQYPDFEKEFIVMCDASADGIGSVSSQGIIGKVLPVAYISRLLTEAEKTTQQLRGNCQS